MNETLIFSARGTDLRIAVAVVLGLAAVLLVGTVVIRHAPADVSDRPHLTFSAAAPEIVRAAPKVIVQQLSPASSLVQ